MEVVNHTLSLENRKRICLTAVLEVLAFSDKEIRLKLKNNEVIVLSGENLKIVCFDSSASTFTASGNFTSVRYRAQNASIVKKVFK